MEFKIHKITGQIENIFIAEYETGLLILDGGSRGDASRIERFIKYSLGKSAADIRLCVVSHVHPDHAGGALLLRKNYGIPIAAHRVIDMWYSGMGGFFQHLLDTIFADAVSLKMGRPFRRMWRPRKINPDFLLDDGSVLPFFTDWRVIHSPGHTTHDIVLHNENKSILYAADIILRVNGRLMPPFPVPLPDLFKKSLEKLSTLDVNRILLAHGDAEEKGSDIFLKILPPIRNVKNLTLRLVKPFTELSPEVSKHKK
ncbi:MAG: MBL fold metallo-hydrolase [Spirochaetes bacterium]|nr:MBL fold metallo-hydrolase [Spirochaetota bacterium]